MIQSNRIDDGTSLTEFKMVTYNVHTQIEYLLGISFNL